jgi:hypothetical protein
MNNNDQKLLSQLLNRGIMDDEIIKLMQDAQAKKTKEMIKKMGTKYCCHLYNAPKKVQYGI